MTKLFDTESKWDYPNIGIPFGETQTAGHDMYFIDYRDLDANGEPAIAHVENEGDVQMYTHFLKLNSYEKES